MSQALQSAQKSLQQAGQQGQQGDKGESTEAEMGQEMGQSGGQGQGQQAGQGKSNKSDSTGKGNQAKNKGSGGGMGSAGIGFGGHAGAQQPLPGKKHEVLVPGTIDAHGKQLSKSYMGTPDPTKDKAAYYSIVPEKVKAAEASLNREDIPIAVKKPVQRYFESIQPQRK